MRPLRCGVALRYGPRSATWGRRTVSAAHRSFGIYSGKYDGHRRIYEDTHGVSSVPLATESTLFADLVCAGLSAVADEVSVYIRAYDNGRLRYLNGRTYRWRNMPPIAAHVFSGWLERHPAPALRPPSLSSSDLGRQ